MQREIGAVAAKRRVATSTLNPPSSACIKVLEVK